MDKYPEITIYGACPSKSNCYKVVRREGHGTLSKSDALKSYEQSFFMQNTLRNKKISRRFKFTVDVYYKSDRPDLDNSLKILLDCLQLCGTIANDRLCAEIHARKFIDKTNPRVVFTIEELL
ncbi:RusA family crossover junction endodeoxyribonuclease [Turicimonas muris]|uniref:RusA family crossover junction endodeoxyribonuclease n=1 Tax=Turicimonas muris TaxID=1796652 RepID=UPI00272D9333|nr:RusA family crossover junction endodeoxyribonuclease [Turicimonas muris]